MTVPSRLLSSSVDEDVQRWLKAGVDWRPASGERERIWQAIAGEAGKVAVALAVAEVARESTQVAASAGNAATSGLLGAARAASVGAGSTKLALVVVALKAVGVGLGIGAGLLVGGHAVSSHHIERPAATAPTPATTAARLVEESAKVNAQIRTSGSAQAEREDSVPQESNPATIPSSASIRVSSEATGTSRASEPSTTAHPLHNPAPLTAAEEAQQLEQRTATQTLLSTAPSMHHDAVRQESRLVSMVRSALRQGRAASALETLSELDQRYPSGQLGEERAVLRIEAAVLGGQSGEASRLAERFVERYPTSLNLDHIREVARVSRRSKQ